MDYLPGRENRALSLSRAWFVSAFRSYVYLPAFPSLFSALVSVFLLLPLFFICFPLLDSSSADPVIAQRPENSFRRARIVINAFIKGDIDRESPQFFNELYCRRCCWRRWARDKAIHDRGRPRRPTSSDCDVVRSIHLHAARSKTKARAVIG